jgi:hypothetical protein
MRLGCGRFEPHMPCFVNEKRSVMADSGRFDSERAAEAARKRWEKKALPVSAQASPGDPHELGRLANEEALRRLRDDPESVRGTELRNYVAWYREYVEAQERRAAHGGVDPQVVEAVFRKVQEWDDCFLGFLKDVWKHKRMPRKHTAKKVRDYAVLLEAELARVRAFAAEVSGSA